jgi:catechol-2,3-dioxygenase
MAVSQLAYVGIGVSDMTRWKAFAGDVLGLQVVEGEADGTVFLRMDEYHHRLALQIGPAAAKPGSVTAGR